jgi:hypothetical protein
MILYNCTLYTITLFTKNLNLIALKWGSRLSNIFNNIKYGKNDRKIDKELSTRRSRLKLFV